MTTRTRTDPITGEVNESPVIRPFADWLREQSRGRTHEELSEALWDLISRVDETHKKGSLTLTLYIEPLKADPAMLVVTDEIRLKLPEFDRPGSTAYIDHDGNLTRQNPNQPELTGLRAIENDNITELKEAV